MQTNLHLNGGRRRRKLNTESAAFTDERVGSWKADRFEKSEG